jgi:Raf kinase inhibitor-like YbhB/YbcL family protein
VLPRMRGRRSAPTCVALIVVLAACDVPPSPSEEASAAMTDQLTVTSTAFEEGGPIPSRHTCDGDDVSPPLGWTGAPPETAAFALIVDDPDARGWIHWLGADLPGEATGIQEGSPAGTEGRNGFGNTGWGGPCPPSGTHRYEFEVFALSEQLGLDEGFEAAELHAAIEGKVLAAGTLTGVYQRGE